MFLLVLKDEIVMVCCRSSKVIISYY
jgi:hypothetical protein